MLNQDEIAVLAGLTDREQEQVEAACSYSEKYSGAGIPGHSLLILVAKLFKLLLKLD